MVSAIRDQLRHPRLGIDRQIGGRALLAIGGVHLDRFILRTGILSRRASEQLRARKTASASGFRGRRTIAARDRNREAGDGTQSNRLETDASLLMRRIASPISGAMEMLRILGQARISAVARWNPSPPWI